MNEINADEPKPVRFPHEPKALGPSGKLWKIHGNHEQMGFGKSPKAPRFSSLFNSAVHPHTSRELPMKLQSWPLSPSNRTWRGLNRLSTQNFPRSCSSTRCFSASTTSLYRPLECLQDARVDTFRQQCFVPEKPAVLPPSHFHDLPALKNWFHQLDNTKRRGTRLNVEYLQSHAADAFVPLELTETASDDHESTTVPSHQNAPKIVSFRKLHAPLTLFLEWMRMAQTSPQSTRLYLAQCQLLDLPPILRQDFPTPAIVAQAGKGDVYDTNVWIGHPPTYTPLHRDPNPNLFVQLAGRKIVRLLPPADGQAVFSAIRRQLGKSGSKDAAAFRGEEMMQGQEAALLDKMIWQVQTPPEPESVTGYEAYLGAGDAVFIPKGWWHSIRGVGDDVTASVSMPSILEKTLGL